MGGSIAGFGYTFSCGSQFLDWFVYAAAAMAVAFEYAGALYAAAPNQALTVGPLVDLAQL